MKLLTTLLFFLPSFLSAQYVEIDLTKPDLVDQSISADHKGVKIKNMIPHITYKIKIASQQFEVTPLPIPTAAANVNGCDAIKADLGIIRDELMSIKDEVKYFDYLKNMKKKAEDATKAKVTADAALAPCLQEFYKDVDAITALTNSVTYDFAFDVKKNMIITVSVEKQDDRERTFVFRTPDDSPWLIHWGFTYQPNLISKQDHFFVKSIPNTTDSFSVTKKHRSTSNVWENISPTVMFTYPFDFCWSKKKNADIKGGISGILSTNFSSFSAGAGLSLVVKHNVALGTGIMFTQKHVLKGEYKDDGTEIVQQNLSFDQLHERKWMPELFFTIAFRFDRNPFSGNNTQTSTSPVTPQPSR